MLSAMLTVEGREAAKKAAADRRAVVRLLREMHAAGWRHASTIDRLVDEESAEVFVVHEWSRGAESVFAYTTNGIVYDWVSYRPLGSAVLQVDGGWIDTVGVKRLHALASAAGVLSVPRERAA